MTQEQVFVDQLRLHTAGEILLYADFLAERGDERAELALMLATYGNDVVEHFESIKERVRRSTNDATIAWFNKIEPLASIIAHSQPWRQTLRTLGEPL